MGLREAWDDTALRAGHVNGTGAMGGASPGPAPPELVLTGQQHALLTALGDTDQDVEAMYMGALQVLQSGNPDRFALAGHAVRELMEKLPEYLDVPSRDKSHKGQASLNVKVRELAVSWVSISDDVMDAVEMNPRIKRFHKKAMAFFDWFEKSFQKRRDQTAAALRALDATGRSLPPPIEELQVRHWGLCNDFFQSVSHHRKKCSEEEFNAWLDDLERFLLDHLRPRTFDDFSKLDAIIAEGEQDA